MLQAIGWMIIGAFLLLLMAALCLTVQGIKRTLRGADYIERSPIMINLDKPQRLAGGLTIRQLRADIAGAGFDVGPTLSIAELFAARNQARASRG
jgi:hypothetical protein